jgi:hypothetical protein
MFTQRFIRYSLLATFGWSLPGLTFAQGGPFGPVKIQPSSAAIVKQETERVLAEHKRKEAAKQAAIKLEESRKLFAEVNNRIQAASSTNSSKNTSAPVKQPQLMTTKPAKELVRQPSKPYLEGSFTGNLKITGTSAATPANASTTPSPSQPSSPVAYPADKNCWDPSARKAASSELPMSPSNQRPVWNHVERQGKSIDERCWVPAGRFCESTRPWLCAPQSGEVTIRINTQFCRPDYYKQFAVSRSYGYCYEGFYHNHWHSSRWNADHGCWMHYDRGVNSWYYWCAPDRCYYPVSYKPYNSFTCENVVCHEEQSGNTLPPLPGRDE